MFLNPVAGVAENRPLPPLMQIASGGSFPKAHYRTPDEPDHPQETIPVTGCHFYLCHNRLGMGLHDSGTALCCPGQIGNRQDIGFSVPSV
jgi:hypothetical protein